MCLIRFRWFVDEASAVIIIPRRACAHCFRAWTVFSRSKRSNRFQKEHPHTRTHARTQYVNWSGHSWQTPRREGEGERGGFETPSNQMVVRSDSLIRRWWNFWWCWESCVFLSFFSHLIEDDNFSLFLSRFDISFQNSYAIKIPRSSNKLSKNRRKSYYNLCTTHRIIRQ